MKNALASDPQLTPFGPWWRQLNRYHWFVFMVASLAWLFDCLDQQLFLLARNGAMKALLPAGLDVKLYGGYATTIFVAGWATGGLIFGAVGDRIGRAKTLALSVLLYSVCTGLSAFSKGWVDFALFRFATGLGVGGVFGLSVALVADSLPEQARPGALGMLQALSAIGNITAGSIAIILGNLEGGAIPAGSVGACCANTGAALLLGRPFVVAEVVAKDKGPKPSLMDFDWGLYNGPLCGYRVVIRWL